MFAHTPAQITCQGPTCLVVIFGDGASKEITKLNHKGGALPDWIASLQAETPES